MARSSLVTVVLVVLCVSSAVPSWTACATSTHGQHKGEEQHKKRHKAHKEGDSARLEEDVPVDDPGTPDVNSNCTAFGAFAATRAELSTLSSNVSLTQDVADIFNNAAAAGTRLTTFAADNGGYEKLGDARIAELQADADISTEIVLGAVAIGEYRVSDLTDGQELPTLAGVPLIVGVAADGTTTVSARGATAKIVDADFKVCSGIAHIIDTLLAPPAPTHELELDCSGAGYVGAPCCKGSPRHANLCPHGGVCAGDSCTADEQRTVCSADGKCEACGGARQKVCTCAFCSPCMTFRCGYLRAFV